MRLISLLVIVNFYTTLVCLGQVDSAAIELKAKLLTTSRFGIADVDSILSDITRQSATFLKSNSPNTILLKIDFNQRFFLGNTNEQLLWLGDCSYYLAFNIRRNKFYRIGGFDELDIVDFFNDFESMDNNLLNIDYSKTSEIDFYCLKEYSKLSARRRLKKAPCFHVCSTKLKTVLVIPQQK